MKILNEIAYKLLFNYITNSFPDNCDDSFSNLSDILNDESLKKVSEDKTKRIRNIMIVGAGSSADSFYPMPLGSEMAEEIKNVCLDNLTSKSNQFNEKYKYEESEIKALTGKTEMSFENFLSLVNKIALTPHELRKKITEMTGLRYAPSLFNEIVAHMLKHSFLDVVINYNFEETLDQAIEDEIGSSNYHEILSDGHCPPLSEITKGGRLTTPIYIKPHGTRSHKSTLRFTNNHYLELPDDIRQMLSDLLEGKLGEDSFIMEVNLFVVGFALESFELNEILKKCFKKKNKTRYFIYHISPYPIGLRKKGGKKLESFLQSIGATGNTGGLKTNKFNIGNDHKIIPVNTRHYKEDNPDFFYTSTLSKIFSLIWRIAQDSFKDGFKPRSIAKHEIIYYLLSDKKLSSEKGGEKIELRKSLYKQYENFTSQETGKYFLDRALIEIALAFIRNKGVVDIIELLKGKPGKYHGLYLKVFKAGKHNDAPVSIFDLANSFIKDEAVGHNIFLETNNQIKLPGLKDQNNSIQSAIQSIILDESYKNNHKLVRLISKIYIEKRKSNPQQWLLPFYIFLKLISSRHLSARTKGHINKNCDKKISDCHRRGEENKGIPFLAELVRLFEKSFNSHYYIINPRERDTIHNMFESFDRENILHTNLSFDHKFKWLLTRDWDIALIVAERGAFLNFLKKLQDKEKKAFKNKKIILICSAEALLPYSTDTLNAGSYCALKKSLLNESINESNLTLLLTPSREHNHHLALFLKVNPKGKVENTMLRLCDNTDSPSYDFLLSDAIYNFRMSFSNSIDPVVIKAKNESNSLPGCQDKVARDYAKLINLFNLLLRRSLSYMKDLDKTIFDECGILSEITNSNNDYKNWGQDKFSTEACKFLKTIYTKLNIE